MHPKRIILMYISDVSGHHSATLAIEKAIKTLEPDTEVLNLNAFNYTNPVSEKIVNRIYMGLIKRAPKIWDYLYDNPSIVRKVESIKKNIHKLNSPKFKNLFDKFKPDAVACSQAFPCGMVADYKSTYNAQVPLVAVLTDFVPHSYWLYEKVNFYISPSEDVSDKLVKKGIDAGKVKSFGIPFDPAFNKPQERNKLLAKFGLEKSAPVILIMGGGQGLGPIKTIVKSLEKVKEDIQEIIVTGTNKKLYKSLKRRVKKYKKKIIVLSYVNNIDELMDVANIIISKPGGVTTAEVLAKKIPMVIVKPLPGQEANNTNYLTEKGAAIKVEDPQKINLVIDELLVDCKKLSSLSSSAEAISKPNASFDIARLLLDLANG